MLKVGEANVPYVYASEESKSCKAPDHCEARAGELLALGQRPSSHDQETSPEALPGEESCPFGLRL